MRDRLLTLLEVAFLVVLHVGLVFTLGWPVAMIVGGLVGAAACEYAQRTGDRQ